MYKIDSVQDISRPRCKRFLAHVVVSTGNKSDIKKIVANITNRLKISSEFSNEATKRKFDCDAHVVRLYIHFNKNIVCQSMWVNKKAEDIPLPNPLEYNDSIGDIGIMWLGDSNA